MGVVTGFAHVDDQGVASHEEFTREALERVMGDLAAASGIQRQGFALLYTRAILVRQP